MEASHQTEPLKEPRLPLELLIMIGEVLAGDLCFGSLANLNHTCRAGYAGTLSTLYDTMEMDERDLLGLKSDCAVRCEGWKYVKHLIVNKARDNLWTSGPLSNSAARQQLLPGLRFILFKGNKTTLFHPIEGPKYRPGPVHLVCIGSTRISTIVEVMLSTTEARDHYHRSSGRRGERRITQLFAKGDFVPDMICKITFEGSGRIHPDPGHRVHPQTRSVWRMICVEDVGIILTTTVIKDEGRELVHHLLAFLDVTCPATSLGDYYGDGWDTQFYCGIAVLPVLMSLGGLLPLWVTMGIEMYDDYTHPDLFREVFGEGIKEYLITRRRYIDERLIMNDRRFNTEISWINTSAKSNAGPLLTPNYISRSSSPNLREKLHFRLNTRAPMK